jgi:DNA invertase Pin-like site-specific DNA recombinase
LLNDFDVLLVSDLSRLTRDVDDLSMIRRKFAGVGVLIQSIADPVTEGDFDDVLQSIIQTDDDL